MEEQKPKLYCEGIKCPHKDTGIRGKKCEPVNTRLCKVYYQQPHRKVKDKENK